MNESNLTEAQTRAFGTMKRILQNNLTDEFQDRMVDSLCLVAVRNSAFWSGLGEAVRLKGDMLVQEAAALDALAELKRVIEQKHGGCEEVDHKLALIDEAYRTFGMKAARGLANKLGFPEPLDHIIDKTRD